MRINKISIDGLGYKLIAGSFLFNRKGAKPKESEPVLFDYKYGCLRRYTSYDVTKYPAATFKDALRIIRNM